MIDGMTELNGEMVLGSDWHLGCWYGRGSTKSQLLHKKKTMSPIAFAQNYESKWVGSVDGSLININKLLKLRTLSKAKIKADKLNNEYVLGIDVARSMDTGNNQSSIVVVEIKRNKNGKITFLNLVNIINISNALNFTAQAVEIKKIKRAFNAKIAIVDSNGLGIGLLDELMKESFEPSSGESLGCWDTVNTDMKPETRDAERCLYDLKPQSANSDIMVTFIDMVENGKLRLLEKKQDSDYDIKDKENYIENMLPFIQTDFLIEEVANLQLKHLQSGKISVEKVIKKINKDRFSALAYALWYVKTYEDNAYQDDIDDYDLWSQYTYL
jgi:ribonucleoside-diphosphate reductase alpha chain